VKRRVIESLVVVPGVLSGVVDQGEALAFAVGVKRPEANDELVHHRCELGDIGAVPRVGEGDERDAAICRDNQSESTDAQVASLLLGVATLRDRGPHVG